MSTQSSTFPAVPFSQTHQQQSFRLLELPPELLELLSSDNCPTLWLKSSDSSSKVSSTTTPRTKGAESGYVHLCSPTQTYQVRQVSTSNSLFVTLPTKLLYQTPLTNGHNGETDAAHEDEVALSAAGALTAVGQVSSVLELHTVQLDVRALVGALVLVWHWNDMDVLDQARRGLSKRALFDQVPAPDGQIEHAWRELLAFQFKGRGYVPDHRMLYQAWKQVMLRFTLSAGLGVMVGAKDFLEVDNTTEDDSDDDERELLDAVRCAIWWSSSLRKAPETTTEQDQIGELDQERTTAWVGKLVLRHVTKDGKAVDTEQYMTSWRNLLPEQWGNDLRLDLLDQDSYQLGSNLNGQRVIKWTGEDSCSATSGVAGERNGLERVAKDSKTGIGPVGKRKWHEKFMDSRNVKK